MPGLDVQTAAKRKADKSKRALSSFIYEVWLPWAQENLSSWKMSKRIAESRIIPFFGSDKLCDIDQKKINDWLSFLEEQNLAATTRNRNLYVLISIFDLAIRLKWLSTSPCPKAEPVKQEKKPERLLNLADTKMVYDALLTSGKTEALAIILMLYTGASKNVILKARWDDLLLDENILLRKIANGKRARVLLTNDAVRLIRKLPPESHWLFPSKDKTKPLSDIFYFWNTFRTNNGFPDLLLREIQQSYAQWKFRLGNSDLSDPIEPAKSIQAGTYAV